MIAALSPNPNSIRILDLVNTVNQLIAGQCNLWNMEPWTQPPTNPTEGTLVMADGVNWNPGSGYGLYLYKSGTWKLVA
jgi:hypothetical protein